MTSSNKFASQAGIDILKSGGNAIDAAVAVGFALAVTHPGAGNIGGGGFMVIRLADGTVTTIDFRETAPMAAHRNMFLDDDGNVVPGKSWNTAWAAGVPGSVDGFGKVHELYGQLPWKSVLDPAISLAKDGYPLDYKSVIAFRKYRNYLSQDSVTKSIFTGSKGILCISEKFTQPDLAATLSRIRDYGHREFYEGLTATYIMQCMDRTGGLITFDDLLNYSSVIREPVSFDYRGFTIHSMPPPSSGGIALAGILNQIENIDMDALKYHGSDHIQVIAEAERNVYADRAYFLGDMDFVPVPIQKLVSQDYADTRWSEIDFSSAGRSANIVHGDIPFHYKESEETTHYSVTDKWGNAVSVTTTINGWFGNGITVDHAGFLLNNEMDDFSSKPGVPNAYGLVGAEANAIAPNKRMLSSMTPTIVEDSDGELFLVAGSPGGSTIITTVAQIIMNVIDFDMNLESAVESPRFHHQWLPDVIFHEWGGVRPLDKIKLLNLGYDFKFRSSIGEANCIHFDSEKGKFYASSDSRRMASAKAY